MTIAEEVKEECTGFGHRWSTIPRPPSARVDPRGWFDRYMRCDNCGSERRVSIHRASGFKRIRYYYVDGYKDWTGSRRDFAVSWVWRQTQRAKRAS